MSWLYLLCNVWPSSASYLLLVGLLSRQLGLRMGVQVIHALTCSLWGLPSNQGLFQNGDVVIGGLFGLHFKLPTLENDFKLQPLHKACTG